MSELRVETRRMPAARLGKEASPSDRFHAVRHGRPGSGRQRAREDTQHFGYGLREGWMPHRAQDEYTGFAASAISWWSSSKTRFSARRSCPKSEGPLVADSQTQRPRAVARQPRLPARESRDPKRLDFLRRRVEPLGLWHSPFASSPLFAAIVRAADARKS